MAIAELVGGRVVVHTEFRDRDLVRQVPGLKYKEQTWSAPVSWALCWQLRGVFGDRITIGDKLKAWAASEYDGRVAHALAWRDMAMRDTDTDGDPRLFRYQRTGVKFLKLAGSAVLADDMGTGKTLHLITAIEELDAYPALIVAPNTVRWAWESEYAKWNPGRSVRVVQGGMASRRRQLEAGADVYVTSWDVLRSHSRLAGYGSIRLTDKEKCEGELNRPWGAVVADEAHRAKDPKSKQTRALWAVGASAEHRYALTGTPIEQSPADLWSLLHFVSPEEWPARTQYLERYCSVGYNVFGGLDVFGLREDTRDELFQIIDPRFLRRPKSIVLPSLPPKTYVTRYVEMKPEQAKAYKQFEEESVAQLRNGVAVALSPLTVAGRLTQLASAFAEFVDEDIRLCEPSPKLDALEDLLVDLGGEAVVVFAASKQLIKLAEARLDKAGITYGSIHGDVGDDERARNINDFQDGHLRVMLCTFGAGAEGITLTRAAYTIFLQRHWSSIKNRQAEDRTHRPGQKADHVTLIDLVAKDTIDEATIGLIQKKGELFEEITRDEETLRRFLCER